MVNSVWVAAVDSGVGAGQGRGVGAAISRVFGGAQLAIAPIRPTSLAPAVCEDLCKPIEPKWLCVCLMLLLLLPARGCPPEAEAAGVDLNLSSEALITRPKAQSGIFSASPQMSKKTASATAEMWGASGPYSP